MFKFDVNRHSAYTCRLVPEIVEAKDTLKQKSWL